MKEDTQMEKDKIFRYNDQSERYHSMNKIYILATTILWLQFIIYLLLKLNSNSIVSITAYSNLALIALFAIGNVIIFVRQKGGSLLKRVVMMWELNFCFLACRPMQNFSIML